MTPTDHDMPDDAPSLPSGRRTSGALARMRLTARVAEALRPLERARLDHDFDAMGVSPGGERLRIRTDLIIRALDLRVRVCLLPGSEALALNRPETLTDAITLLVLNPETASVILVADDESLSSRVVEVFDRPDAVSSSSDTSVIKRLGPLNDVVPQYLRQIDPGWSPPEAITAELHIHDLIASSATERLQALRLETKRVPEWREARSGLDSRDVAWISEMIIQVMEAETDDIDGAIRTRAGRRRS